MFPAAIPHTLRMVKRLYSTNLQRFGETRPITLDLPAPKRTHLPLDHGLIPRHTDFKGL